MKIPGTFGPSVGTTTADQRIAEVMTVGTVETDLERGETH